MQQRIVGFHQDAERHWVADLECGHAQHVRHDPPWQQRPWVLQEESRNARLGTTLDCGLCEGALPEAGAAHPADAVGEAPGHLSPSAAAAYVDARIQGLCHEGALEIAERVDGEPSA